MKKWQEARLVFIMNTNNLLTSIHCFGSINMKKARFYTSYATFDTTLSFLSRLLGGDTNAEFDLTHSCF